MDTNNEIVLQRILARKKTGNKNDGHKIGLIFEGGGMRGVFSGGTARALAKLGVDNCFDVVYGSSSGSCAAAYFLSGQTTIGDSIYYENLTNFSFIKPWRLSKLMDIDYLGNLFRNGGKSLNQEAVRDSDTLLKIYVSNANSGAHKCFTNKSEVDLVSLLMASCAAPGFYNKPVKIEKGDYLDGSVEQKLPVLEAIRDGCTDILVVSTVLADFRGHTNFLSTLRTSLLMWGLAPQFRKAHSGRHEMYNKNLDIAFGKKRLDNVNIYTLAPDYRIGMAEIRSDKLRDNSGHGFGKVTKAFREVGK